MDDKSTVPAEGWDIIILGGGRTAFHLAQRLETDRFDTVIIEQDEATCAELAGALKTTRIIHGDGTDLEALQSAGISGATAGAPANQAVGQRR